jgi:hypothetical protein
VFPVDFGGSEHVYRAHPINIQLVTDPVLMLAKEEHGRMRFWFFSCVPHAWGTFYEPVCMCLAVLEAEMLWSELEIVKMVALSSKFFKEY